MAWHHKLYFGKTEYFNMTTPHVAPEKLLELDAPLGEDEIVMPYKKYNELFGTTYTNKTLDTFEPHTVNLSQYRYYDVAKKLPYTKVK